VLRAKGAFPPGWIENRLRGILWKICRQYSLASLPKWAHSLILRTPIVYPARVIVWAGKEWEIITGFTV
jgi:hypothetical protein